MDHYIKIGDNDIHAAQLVYSISAIIVLFLLSTVVIHRSVIRDLKSIELTAIGRKNARDKKRSGGNSVA
jgi:transmembrane 9 superfamily member 2/4